MPGKIRWNFAGMVNVCCDMRNVRIIVMALLAALAALVVGCVSDASKAPGLPSRGFVDATTNATSNATTNPSTAKVTIDNFTFSPAELTVAPGTRVTWINHDDIPHTATSGSDPKSFSSPALDTDETFSFVFTASGDYPYFCAIHPHMRGRIIVK
jgi:plastocyanin